MNSKETIGLMPKASKEKKSNHTNQIQLEIVDSFKKMIEEGAIQEFIVVGLDSNRQVVVASYCSDIFEGVGMLELGKLAFINQQSQEEEE